MVFSSILFLFRFLPIFLIIYFMAPKRMRNLILFFGSLCFYAWGEPVYVLLMLFSTVSDYLHGRGIEACQIRQELQKENGRKWKRYAKILLVSSIIVNLFVLCFFKYADFLIQVVNMIPGVAIPLLKLPLPIGISFYTFQTMSYTIDVYRKDVKAQKNILTFGVFVTMFPQLIAGPIVKYRTVAQELSERRASLEEVSCGIRRFIVGLSKKVLIANNVGLIWTQISGQNLNETSVLSAWLGILAYAFQIYFDFSGYSDMAIGLGTVLGFHFPENFNYPYIARSITEFWHRWHISLSSWFKEYVYIPLGGNRKGIGKQIRNILIVWALTGIWHGAGWNFLLWGLWFALFLILEKLFLKKFMERLPAVFGWIYSMIIVLFSWVFFSLEQLSGILSFFKAMFGLNGAGLIDGAGIYQWKNALLLLLIAAIAATPFPKLLAERITKNRREYISVTGSILEKAVLVFLLFLSTAYIVEASYNPFLYFRF